MTANMSISQSESEENDQPPPPPEQKVQSGQGQIRQQRRGSTKDLNNQRYFVIIDNKSRWSGPNLLIAKIQY